jgi:hypothetical protein
MEIYFKGEFGFFISTVSHSQKWRTATAYQRADSRASSHTPLKNPVPRPRRTRPVSYPEVPILAGKGGHRACNPSFPVNEGGGLGGSCKKRGRASDHILISQAQKTLGLCPFGMCLSAPCETKTVWPGLPSTRRFIITL